MLIILYENVISGSIWFSLRCIIQGSFPDYYVSHVKTQIIPKKIVTFLHILKWEWTSQINERTLEKDNIDIFYYKFIYFYYLLLNLMWREARQCKNFLMYEIRFFLEDIW